jgi:hypothetical protein
MAVAVPLASAVVSITSDAVGRAVLVGQRGPNRTDNDINDLLLGGDLGHGDGDGSVGSGDEDVEALLVRPFAELRCTDIGLVLMVGHQGNYVSAEHRTAKIGDGHLDRFCATGSLDIGVDTGEIANVADDDVIACPECLSEARNAHKSGNRYRAPDIHFPPVVLVIRSGCRALSA